MFEGKEAELIIGTYEDYVVGYGIETSLTKSKQQPDNARKKLKTSNGKEKSKQNGSKMGTKRICLEQTFAVRSHSGSVRTLAVCQDGSLAFSAGHDEMTNLFSLKRRKLLQTSEGAINCATFVQSSTPHLICGAEDGNIYIYECKSSSITKVKTLKGHKAAITSLDVHPSGKVLLSLAKDDSMRTWNLIKGRSAYVTHIKTQAHIVRWSKGGDEFIIAANNEIYLYNNKGLLKRSIKLGKRINSVEFITNNIFAVAIDSGKLEFFDSSIEVDPSSGGDNDPVMSLEAHESRIKSVKCFQATDDSTSTTTTTTSSESDEDSTGESSIVDYCIATASSNGEVKLWCVSIQGGTTLTRPPKQLACVDLGARLTCMEAAIRAR